VRSDELTARYGGLLDQTVLAAARAQSGGPLRGLDRSSAAVGGLVGMFAARAVGKKVRASADDHSLDFPADVDVVLTPTELLVFRLASRRTEARRLAAFPRSTVTARRGRIFNPVRLDAAGGGIVQFQLIRRVGGDAVLAELERGA
jgi:hypothetical protein